MFHVIFSSRCSSHTLLSEAAPLKASFRKRKQLVETSNHHQLWPPSTSLALRGSAVRRFFLGAFSFTSCCARLCEARRAEEMSSHETTPNSRS